MMIFLTHPVHGQKIAYDEREALNDEKQGWTRNTETFAPRDQYFAEQLEEVSTIPVKRKPGRPRKVA